MGPEGPVTSTLKHVAPPLNFVKPSFDDRILRLVPDPDSPSSTPYTNPWRKSYFLGDTH